MWKAMAVAALVMTFAGTAAAQSNLSPPPSQRGASAPVPLRGPGDDPSGVRSRGGGSVDLNNNSATGRSRREQGSGSMPQRLGPIAPGTGARDHGVPDSSTYNPGAPAVR